jgi:hypothetical protein
MGSKSLKNVETECLERHISGTTEARSIILPEPKSTESTICKEKHLRFALHTACQS